MKMVPVWIHPKWPGWNTLRRPETHHLRNPHCSLKLFLIHSHTHLIASPSIYYFPYQLCCLHPFYFVFDFWGWSCPSSRWIPWINEFGIVVIANSEFTITHVVNWNTIDLPYGCITTMGLSHRHTNYIANESGDSLPMWMNNSDKKSLINLNTYRSCFLYV